jgi:hypothetical protein
MVGKTFKGMTDELLAWQTKELQARQVRSDGHTVHVRPELVVEIELDGVVPSPRYPGGIALRFARVVRYRPDKDPAKPTPSTPCAPCAASLARVLNEPGFVAQPQTERGRHSFRDKERMTPTFHIGLALRSELAGVVLQHLRDERGDR